MLSVQDADPVLGEIRKRQGSQADVGRREPWIHLDDEVPRRIGAAHVEHQVHASEPEEPRAGAESTQSQPPRSSLERRRKREHAARVGEVAVAGNELLSGAENKGPAGPDHGERARWQACVVRSCNQLGSFESRRLRGGIGGGPQQNQAG
jgi:hypothetical protein